jgi:hypothetical protein
MGKPVFMALPTTLPSSEAWQPEESEKLHGHEGEVSALFAPAKWKVPTRLAIRHDE